MAAIHDVLRQRLQNEQGILDAKNQKIHMYINTSIMKYA